MNANDDADVRVHIRRLRIDPALAGRLSPAELQAAIQAAVAERLGAGEGVVAAPREMGVSASIADAVAAHVRGVT